MAKLHPQRSQSQRRAVCGGAAAFCLSWAVAPVLADEPQAPAAPRPPVVRGPLQKTDGPYRLQPGDELDVSVLPRKEYDCHGVVLPDGMIYLKNVGEIKAGGMTISELQKKIVEVLRDNVRLRSPQVSINPTRLSEPEKKPETMPKVTVVGAVGRQGTLDLEPGLRLRKAIDLSGGFVKDADLKTVKLIHKDLTREILDISTDERISDPSSNKLLVDGDSVEVLFTKPAKEVVDTVRIDGEVVNPALYELNPAKLTTLKDLIMASGRLTPTADQTKVELHRKGETTHTYNLEELERRGASGQVTLKPDDEVFIPRAPNRVGLTGAITKPGFVAMQPGQKISDLFTTNPDAALALSSQVDLQHVSLLRDGAETKTINLQNVLQKKGKKDNKEDVALQPNDVILMLPRAEKKEKKGVLEYLGALSPISYLFTAF